MYTLISATNDPSTLPKAAFEIAKLPTPRLNILLPSTTAGKLELSPGTPNTVATILPEN